MAGKTSPEETSERKRISIPKADESVLQWWDAQHDVGLSVRMLIRNEIERSGYVDVIYRPVAQLPRRGRPPGSGGEGADAADSSGEAVAPVASITAAPSPAAAATVAQPVAVPQPVAAGGISPIDALMNG